MQKFEHKLRTTVHTRSVEQIMTRTQGFNQQGREFRLPSPTMDNLTTYLRKFQIDRENLNLAKRIMQCESEHNRNKYMKEWKKIKKCMRVRSNFKPQLAAKEPKIYKFLEIPGSGRFMVKMVLNGITSHMKQLNTQSLYLIKFNLGGTQLIPNKEFMTLDAAEGYTCQFLVPLFLKGKTVSTKLIKVVENNLFEAGRFVVSFQDEDEKTSDILTKIGRVVGKVSFSISTQVLQKQCRGGKQNTNTETGQTINMGQIKSV